MSEPTFPDVVGYKLHDKIGGGGFSTVWIATNIRDHRVAACKVIRITDRTLSEDRKKVDKEMRIHAQLKHTNVLELLDAVIVEMKYAQRYHPGYYLLLELAAGGDLFDKIAPDVGLDDDLSHLYFNQLLSGMDYVHKEGVCHRDLKPENILLDAAGTLKICDFGLSTVYKLKDTGRVRMLSERSGSLPYVAPELNGSEPYAAEPIDVWGMGVILFTFLAGNTPWDEPSRNSPEFMAYLSGEILQEQPWCRFSSQALSLIQGLLTVDPRDRFTLADAFQHPWCQRPSQLAKAGMMGLADALCEPLRQSGDMDLAEPDLGIRMEDEDVPMLSAMTQFTQSLMLFSQTQGGRRHEPRLTRFYASLPPETILPLIKLGLESLDAQVRDAPATFDNPPKLRLRIGGQDMRKVIFKGWVEVEVFEYRGSIGSFCVMSRTEGNPLSWRQLWRALIQTDSLSMHVLRKKRV